MIDADVKARGQAVRDILRLQIKGMKDTYEISLPEMYLLLDYIDELERITTPRKVVPSPPIEEEIEAAREGLDG